MIKKYFYLLLVFIFYASENASAENAQARSNLLEKYKSSKELYGVLKNIFYPGKETKKGVNEFYDSLDKLTSSTSPRSVEVLIDLLDFYIGEATIGMINEAIVKKGKSAMPLLRKKLVEYPIPGEMPNEVDLDKIKEKRNAEIVNLMELIYYDVPYALEYKELSPVQLTKLKLFLIQKCLGKYFQKNKFYPRSLEELNENCNGTTDLRVDAWEHSFKYLSGNNFYFLISMGEDGKDNSGDEICPPIQTELHKYPH